MAPIVSRRYYCLTRKNTVITYCFAYCLLTYLGREFGIWDYQVGSDGLEGCRWKKVAESPKRKTDPFWRRCISHSRPCELQGSLISAHRAQGTGMAGESLLLRIIFQKRMGNGLRSIMYFVHNLSPLLPHLLRIDICMLHTRLQGTR